jgi:hypothetical protein
MDGFKPCAIDVGMLVPPEDPIIIDTPESYHCKKRTSMMDTVLHLGHRQSTTWNAH